MLIAITEMQCTNMSIYIVEIILYLSLGVIVYTFLVYPVVIWLLSSHASKPAKTTNSFCSVSMIVAAFNEEAVIEEKILNSLKMNYPAEMLEIIIGSDGSNDRTGEILREYDGRGIRAVCFEERRGKISVLNDLVAQARGEVLVFSDANTIFSQNAIGELVGHFGDSQVGCVCGQLVLNPHKGGQNTEYEGLYWKYENFLKEQEGKLGVLLGANGGIYGIRRELYEVVPSNIIIDDFAIPMRILSKGYKVIFVRNAMAYEETAKSIFEESQRKVRIGAGNYQFLFFMSSMLNIFRGLPSFAYWSHKVLRWLVPFILILAFISNLMLVAENRRYVIIFVVQCLGYLFALAGYCLEKKKKNIKIFSGVYYFVMMNYSLLKGFMRYIRNKQTVTWDKLERQKGGVREDIK